MSGFLRPRKTDVYYVQEFSPFRSPKLLGVLIKVAAAAFAAGVVFAAWAGWSDMVAEFMAEHPEPCVVQTPKPAKR